MSYAVVAREDRSIWWDRLDVDHRFSTNVIIDTFDGTVNAFLSNFYPYRITYKDFDFDTSEHAYQWAKAVDGAIAEDGQSWSEKIRLAPTPAMSKKLGRRCPLRGDWEQIKFRIMKEVLVEKFRSKVTKGGMTMGNMLLGTGDAYLIEGNTWKDCTFGICVAKNCTCGNPLGQNKLGLFLMELRAILRGNI